MKRTLHVVAVLFMALVLVSAPGVTSSAWAHCDGLDGPVVQAARRALETGNANHVLIWVKQVAEAEIMQTFRHALAVRKLGPEARDLADRHFFETVVRIHRQGEGAGFTGLKPAGRDLGPAVPAADRAIETGSLDDLEKVVVEAIRHGLKERFEQVMAKKTFPPDEVAKGQEFVEAYVGFIHYAERIHEAAVHEAPGHHPDH